MSNHLRFLIVDDYALARETLSEMVTDHPDWEVVDVAENGEEAINLVSLSKPEIVLMDIAMPKMNGLEATPPIKALSPDTRIILFSAYSDDGFRQRSLEVGADFFIQKEKLSAAVLEELIHKFYNID